MIRPTLPDHKTFAQSYVRYIQLGLQCFENVFQKTDGDSFVHFQWCADVLAPFAQT